MARLEDLTPGTAVRGILPDSIVTVVAADWLGGNAIRLTYTDAAGKPGQQLLYRDNEPTIEIPLRRTRKNYSMLAPIAGRGLCCQRSSSH